MMYPEHRKQKEQQEKWEQIWSQKDCQSYEKTLRDHKGWEIQQGCPKETKIILSLKY